MASQLQKLMFSIDLMDKVTGPAGRIQHTLGGVADTATDAFSTIAGGTAGVAAAGYTLQAIAVPAHELNMAMGEVRSLEVAEDSLDALSDSAIDFSVKYGGVASDFVRSSYDIQSAIAGLKGNDLAAFTTASAVLAKGTKADVGTITDYMGTMYGIFQNSADEMGKAKWVEQLTGQTATAVQMFKTNGVEMAGAFSSIGANATAAGIAQAEQIAILGKLQSTMSGSEAGTKYAAFLGGVGGAQEKLGLKFTDNQGKMLGMVEILGLLQGQFGDTLDVAESDALKDAFGSDEAVGLIKQLMLDTDGLASSITQIGEVKGMDKAASMAKTMVDPFEQWGAGVNAVKVGLGQALLPVLYPALEGMAEGAGAVYRWTQEFPTLTKWIGYGIVAVVSLVAAVSTFAAVGSVASMVMGFYATQTGLSTIATKLFTGGLSMARYAMLFLNTAVLANPIVAVFALAVGAVVLLVSYWDELKASFSDVEWVQNLMGWVESILGRFTSLGDAMGWIGEKLSFFGFGDDDEAKVPSSSPSLSASRRAESLPGGAGQSIATAVSNSNSNKQTTVNNTINTNRQATVQDTTGHLMLAGA